MCGCRGKRRKRAQRYRSTVSAVAVRSTTVMRTSRRTLGRYMGMPEAKRHLEFHAVKDAETAPEA
jgi:hypothetical protein